jgi:hypothetical protein
MLLIYLPNITPRSKYIFEVIFKNEFNINYEVTDDVQIFKNYQEEKINYSQNRFNNEFFVYSNTLLSENSLQKIDVALGEINQTTVLFFNDNLCDLGFDVFAAAFYMLCRYEEYLPFTPDSYGRFKATDSLAYKNNFLQIPVVDNWMEQLKNALQKKYVSLIIQSSKFDTILTYDIDVAYKFKGRNFVRNIGSSFKDLINLNLKNIQQRIQTLLNKNKDPWDVYDYLKQTIIQNNFSSVFFFLVGDNSKYDRNLDHKNPVIKSFIDAIKVFSKIGVHPSFASAVFTKKIVQEKERLEEIVNKKITKSRQHYLKFLLPTTYNALIEAGITEDYSMCFPDMRGFRAGTSKPFYFYDVKNEKATALKIFPAAFMDGSYIYLHILKENVLQEIYNLIDEVKKVNGTFISIWHNHTVSETNEFQAWRNIHDQMIENIISIRGK